MTLTSSAYKILAWKSRIKWIAIGYALGAATGQIDRILTFFKSF